MRRIESNGRKLMFKITSLNLPPIELSRWTPRMCQKTIFQFSNSDLIWCTNDIADIPSNTFRFKNVGFHLFGNSWNSLSEQFRKSWLKIEFQTKVRKKRNTELTWIEKETKGNHSLAEQNKTNVDKLMSSRCYALSSMLFVFHSFTWKRWISMRKTMEKSVFFHSLIDISDASIMALRV